jgi:hypothetical protein
MVLLKMLTAEARAIAEQRLLGLAGAMTTIHQKLQDLQADDVQYTAMVPSTIGQQLDIVASMQGAFQELFRRSSPLQPLETVTPTNVINGFHEINLAGLLKVHVVYSPHAYISTLFTSYLYIVFANLLIFFANLLHFVPLMTDGGDRSRQ